MVRKNIRVRLVLWGILCLLIVIYQPSFLVIEVSYGSDELSGRVIDLYTQKEPFSGRGLYQPSGAFAPQEEIILYANVTYNTYPVSGKNVAFEIESPSGPWDLGSAVTDEDGIATWSSRLPNETRVDLFGIWHVYATVDIAEETVADTLTFRFGYIVEIVSVRTINKNLQPQKRFGRGSCVGVKLALRNIALMNKTATLTVVVHDNQGTPLPEKVIFEDFVLSPGHTYFYLYCVLEIPEWAALGEAVLIASAFTSPPAEGGVPWCPGVSTRFLITWCDVAVVSVVPSVNEVKVGGVVGVNVYVKNEGYETESFNVSLYYSREFNSDSNWVFINKCNVAALAPGGMETLFFVWNTSGVAVGDYRLKAVASVVLGEIKVANNEKMSDDAVSVVEIWKPPAPAVLPRELLALLLISVGAAAFTIILYLWYRKSEEMSESRSRYEGGSSRRSFRSNPGDSGSSAKPKKSSLKPIEGGSHSFGRRERDSYLKFREISTLLQPRERASSGGRSRDISSEEFREAISSLKRRKRLSDSSVFAVIRVPFVEEQ